MNNVVVEDKHFFRELKEKLNMLAQMNESVLHFPCDYQSLYNLLFHWSEPRREEILRILNFLTAILFFKKFYLSVGLK